MMLVLAAVALFLIAFISYAIFLRHRDAAARRAWQMHCNEQAVANDAARAARRAGLHPE